MNVKSNEIHAKLIANGTRDEMKLKQLHFVPVLEPRMKTQHASRHANNDDLN